MTSCARIAAFTSKLYYCKKAASNCSKQSPQISHTLKQRPHLNYLLKLLKTLLCFSEKKTTTFINENSFLYISYFLAFHSIFFYTQLAFVFSFLRDFRIIHAPTVAFLLFLLLKDFNIFHRIFFNLFF